MKKIERALISVSDKNGVVEFCRGLTAEGVEIVSTGGTARLLRQEGVSVREVEAVTGFPEMLDGRVKTLHPKIHGGILAVRSNPEHQKQLKERGVTPIDLVAVTLYPFEEVAARSGAELAELVENIDIGGPTMIRSAAKNFDDVTVIVDPVDYPAILNEMRENSGAVKHETRARLARKAFARTAAYDAAIAMELQRRVGAVLPNDLRLSYQKVQDLRYGENPHQKAALYLDPASRGQGLAAARLLQGKELSFNNLVDLEAARELVAEFPEAVAGIIKHTNPCGVATGSSLAESFRRALAVDPVSAFGSVIAFNRVVDGETAAELAKLFVEAVVAPGYDREALDNLARKKNLRLIQVTGFQNSCAPGLLLRSISGGLLAQTPDEKPVVESEWKCVTERQPSDEEMRSLVFAWRVVKHVKSNAIVYARDGALVSVGAGQMSRVDSVRLGAMKARDLKHDLAGTALASDAFFPFADGVEEAAKAGATSVVQPGGSIRDAEVIQAANRQGLTMMFTGTRHFRH